MLYDGTLLGDDKLVAQQARRRRMEKRKAQKEIRPKLGTPENSSLGNRPAIEGQHQRKTYIYKRHRGDVENRTCFTRETPAQRIKDELIREQNRILDSNGDLLRDATSEDVEAERHCWLVRFFIFLFRCLCCLWCCSGRRTYFQVEKLPSGNPMLVSRASVSSESIGENVMQESEDNLNLKIKKKIDWSIKSLKKELVSVTLTSKEESKESNKIIRPPVFQNFLTVSSPRVDKQSKNLIIVNVENFKKRKAARSKSFSGSSSIDFNSKEMFFGQSKLRPRRNSDIGQNDRSSLSHDTNLSNKTDGTNVVEMLLNN